MYGMIVDLANDNNITDEVGLSIDKNSLTYSIVNSDEWKRSVISKYINVMSSYGVNMNIVHYVMTLQN
jgi:hypothetical protein